MKKLMILLAATMSCIGQPHLMPHHLTAIRNLAVGIEQSEASLVMKTVRKSPYVLKVRISPYGDTPLMAAIRKYGQTLQAIHDRPTKITASTIIGGTIAGIVTGELVSRFISYGSGLLAGSVAFAVTCGYLATPRISSQEQIVEFLIHATPDLSVRNREGLTALDILRAYHHYAQELKETSWFHFHALLQQES